VVWFLLGAGGVGWGQGTKTPYPAMAPIEQYHVASVAEEVALARSAANVAVSGAAEVMVLGSHGYETAAKGTNGFVCLVERSWATNFDDPQFWNSKLRAPHCFNAAAARSVMPAYLKRTELVLSGLPKDQVEARMKEAVAKKVIGAPEEGAMCYMMSKQGYLNDQGRPLASACDVLPSDDGCCELGCEPRRVAGLRCAGKPRAGDDVYGSGDGVVGWHGGGDEVMI